MGTFSSFFISLRFCNMYIVLFVICAASCVYSDPFNIKEYTDISKCLYEISQECLQNKPTVLIYNQDVVKSDAKQTKLESTLNYFFDYNVPVLLLNDINKINNSEEVVESSKLLVVFFEDIEDLERKDLSFDHRIKYVIIIDSIDVVRLSNISSAVQTYDVTIVLADYVKGEHILLSAVPVIDQDLCILKDSPLIEINSCRNGSLDKKDMAAIFPSKVPDNYKLCPFKVGMATMFPYSMIPNKDKLKNLDPITEGRGADIEMMKIIAYVFNATLELFYIFREEESPYLHLEYLNYLFNKSLDACAGGLFRIYGNAVAYSGIYTRQSVIWVYTVDRDIRSWQLLTAKVTDVYYFFIVYVIYSVIWCFIRKFDKNSVSFLKTVLSGWGALLGTTSLQEPRSWKQKTLNIVYLIMSLHLSTYIGAQIYSYLTIQGPPQTYKTVDEFKTSDKKPYLQASTKYFVQDKSYEEFANTSGDCEDFRHCEDTILKNTGATIIPDAYLLPLQAETSVNDEARVLGLQESVLVVFHEMIMRKDFPLDFRFQDIVTRLFEAGICNKLYNDGIGITVVDKARITNKNILSNSYSCTAGCEITLVQLGGAFYIWLLGCLLSLTVFIIELMYK